LQENEPEMQGRLAIMQRNAMENFKPRSLPIETPLVLQARWPHAPTAIAPRYPGGN
jgi:hypothetical protein